MHTSLKSLGLMALLATVLAWAPESGAQLKKLYDPQKVATVQGRIDRLETITRQGRQAVNNRKTLIAHVKTDQGMVVVHLGPAEFLAQQQFRPKPGDVLEATGAPVQTRQGQAFLATTVISKGQVFHLRDAGGVPVWTGQTPGCFGPDTGRAPVRS